MTIITQESCHSVVQVHDNAEAVKLYSKVNPAGRSVDSDVARV